MSINIQTSTGLLEIGGSVTKEKIVSALGYSPADEEDLPNIEEDESGNMVVADESGNIIMQVDASGLTTTTVTAKFAVINGVDITAKLDEHSESISDLTTHTSDSTIHITATERSQWNAKSNFSGDYYDLTNAPNIREDDSGDLVIADPEGNIVFRSDGNGFETTTLTATSLVVDGVDIGTTVAEHETLINNKAASSHTHSNYASTVTTTGSGNAITAISQSGNTITATKGSTFLTAHPTITKSDDTTSTVSPAHGGNFTAVDSITRDGNGHVTKINTKTVTLPAQYTHPSYTAKSSDLYKVAVDSTGHVSAATAVTKADITALGIPAQDTTYSAGTGISLSGTAINNSGVRSVATGSTNGTISVNTNGTSAEVAVKGLGSAAYTASTAYDAAGTAQTKADAALASAKAYTDSLIDGLTAEGDADAGVVQAALNAHKEDTNNPHGVTLSQLGVTATSTELNYVDGVTSSIQTQLDGKAASSHNHAASDITSGTLSSDRLPTVPVAKGGTGATTATGALNNLGIETGTWTPVPLGSDGTTGTFNGYYMKVNNMVTISFYVQCSVWNVSDSNNYFYIDGSSLPYTPDSSSAFYAGGGYVNGLCTYSDSYIFNGWTINNEKKIYARTTYTTTTDDVVLTQASYMYAPSSATEAFLSGTITYKIAT